jgi:hypothetical protein
MTAGNRALKGCCATGRLREVMRRHFYLGPPLHGTFCNVYYCRCNVYLKRTLTIDRHPANEKQVLYFSEQVLHRILEFQI